MDSILTSTKKLLGILEEDENFDVEIMMHINSVFMTLSQLGVGPSKGFSIKDKSTTWAEFVNEDHQLYSSLPSYMYAKVRLIFDPPLSSAVLESLNRIISEFEWRLNVVAETPIA
jgi:hypothetical protein